MSKVLNPADNFRYQVSGEREPWMLWMPTGTFAIFIWLILFYFGIVSVCEFLLALTSAGKTIPSLKFIIYVFMVAFLFSSWPFRKLKKSWVLYNNRFYHPGQGFCVWFGIFRRPRLVVISRKTTICIYSAEIDFRSGPQCLNAEAEVEVFWSSAKRRPEHNVKQYFDNCSSAWFFRELNTQAASYLLPQVEGGKVQFRFMPSSATIDGFDVRWDGKVTLSSKLGLQ